MTTGRAGRVISRKEICKQPALMINALKGINSGGRECPEIRESRVGTS